MHPFGATKEPVSLQLFFHPFSSYSQKGLIALHENGTPFTPRVLSPEDPATGAEFAARWPIGKFPILVDGERTIVEARPSSSTWKRRIPARCGQRRPRPRRPPALRVAKHSV